MHVESVVIVSLATRLGGKTVSNAVAENGRCGASKVSSLTILQ